MGGRAAPCSQSMRGLWAIAAILCLCTAEVSPEEAALLRQAAGQPENFAANRRLAEYYLAPHQIRSGTALAGEVRAHQSCRLR